MGLQAPPATGESLQVPSGTLVYKERAVEEPRNLRDSIALSYKLLSN